MTTAKQVYASAAWRRVRKVVLERDGYLCRVRLPGCTGQATQCDHIISVDDGGSWFDEGNLRAACAHCNNARVNRRTREGWRSARTRVVLVVAPPTPSPFAAYLEQHVSSGDVAIDYGELSVSQHGDHASTMAVRNTLLAALRAGMVDAPRCWVTSTAPDAEDVYPHHEVVVLDPGREDALRQAAGEPELDALVRQWYSQRKVE
jgi:hypothetical protein